MRFERSSDKIDAGVRTFSWPERVSEKKKKKKNNNRKKEDYLTKVSTSPRSPKPVSGIFDFLHASQEEIDSNDDATRRRRRCIFKVRLEKRIPGEKNVFGR
mgnify:CR=1 FL=1